MREITYYVPTRGKLGKRATTLATLREVDLLRHTIVCCPPQEQQAWMTRFPELKDVVCPDDTVTNINQKRRWMLLHCQTPLFFMLDDDLTLQHQENGMFYPGLHNLERLRYYLLDNLIRHFDTYDTVGIGSRPFSHNRPLEAENRQTGWAWGYRVASVLDDLRPAFDRLILHGDVDWCLTLLETGHRNIVDSNIVASARRPSVSKEDGGCGIYRTPELVRQQGELYRSLHPDVVFPRTDAKEIGELSQHGYVVRWKKAFKERA